jgi:nicotinic acid mononucleotide adenylyltransferase
MPTDKIKLPSSMTGKKNIVLVYGGSFCPIHLSHLAVMDCVAETLEKPEYNFEVLGGYFCPSSESWIKRKLREDYLPNAYRESLLLLATTGTRWMVDRSYCSPDEISNNVIEAIRNLYGEHVEVTVVHICGFDAIKGNEKRVPTQYPLVVLDRAGYTDNNVWNAYLEKTTVENEKRLIWISHSTGEVRSSTKVRRLLAKYNDDNVTNLRQTLQDLLPSICIDYILEYNLRKWFKASEVA